MQTPLREETAVSNTFSLSRRTCFTVAAAIVAAPASATTFGPSLDELIADWRMADEETEALVAEADRILASANLPVIEVSYGRWRLRSPNQVHRHFDPMIAAWENDRLQAEFAPSLRQRRDELIAELGKQQAARREAERNCGLTAAEALADQAFYRAHAIRKEIITWRPRDMAEVATKSSWLLEQVREGVNLADNLATIFLTNTAA